MLSQELSGWVGLGNLSQGASSTYLMSVGKLNGSKRFSF